jgi:hypothetical protein
MVQTALGAVAAAGGTSSQAGPPPEGKLFGSLIPLGMEGDRYAYLIDNPWDKPVSLRLSSKAGETWDVDMPARGKARITSRQPLGMGNTLTGSLRSSP